MLSIKVWVYIALWENYVVKTPQPYTQKNYGSERIRHLCPTGLQPPYIRCSTRCMGISELASVYTVIKRVGRNLYLTG